MRPLFVVAAVFAGAALLLAGYAALPYVLGDGFDCATFFADRIEPGPGLALDEPRTRAQEPALAAFLDRAAAEGRAAESDEDRAHALWDALERAAAAHPGPGGIPGNVTWQERNLMVGLSVC